MNFKTAFDLATEKIDFFNDILSKIYLFFIIGLGLLIYFNRHRKEINNVKILIIGVIFTIISSISIFVFLGGQIMNVRKAKQIMDSGNFSVVEGIPENYHPMPKEGHDTERFDVNGVHFEYSDYVLDVAGYHHAASLGGVIFPNKYYRLTYYKLHDDLNSNKILKIEIRQ